MKFYGTLFFKDFFSYRDAQPRIGDLMKTNAPFLKLYTEYVRNFDHAMNLINTWMEKSPKFSCLIKEIQVSMTHFANENAICTTCSYKLGVTNGRELTVVLDLMLHHLGGLNHNFQVTCKVF